MDRVQLMFGYPWLTTRALGEECSLHQLHNTFCPYPPCSTHQFLECLLLLPFRADALGQVESKKCDYCYIMLFCEMHEEIKWKKVGK